MLSSFLRLRAAAINRGNRHTQDMANGLDPSGLKESSKLEVVHDVLYVKNKPEQCNIVYNVTNLCQIVVGCQIEI